MRRNDEIWVLKRYIRVANFISIYCSLKKGSGNELLILDLRKHFENNRWQKRFQNNNRIRMNSVHCFNKCNVKPKAMQGVFKANSAVVYTSVNSIEHLASLKERDIKDMTRE